MNMSTSVQIKCSLAISSFETFQRRREYKLPNLIKDPKCCEILKCGWLKKKTTSLFLGWQDRYFVLYNNHKLIYYKFSTNPGSPKIKQPQVQVEEQYVPKTAAEIEECMTKCGEFDFNILFAKVYVEDVKKFKLSIKGSKRTFLFECIS